MLAKIKTLLENDFSYSLIQFRTVLISLICESLIVKVTYQVLIRLSAKKLLLAASIAFLWSLFQSFALLRAFLGRFFLLLGL